MENNLYHILFTESWDSQKIGHATSHDFQHWTLNYPCVLPGARNCWAPEYQQGLYYWSSKIKNHHSIIFAKFENQAAFELFDPGYDVIDATIRYNNHLWEMAFKDERDGYKAIRKAFSKELTGPYQDITDLLTPKDSEGPIFYKNEIFYDYYGKNKWGTTGFCQLFPINARHGSLHWSASFS